MSERIDKAALRIDAVLYQHRETGQKTTLVFEVPRPLRHDAVINAAAAALRIDILGEHEQGFTTTAGRFVDRDEAGRIAFAAGQTDRPNLHLTSEDVW